MEFLLLILVALGLAFAYSILVASSKPVAGSDFYVVSKDGRVLTGGKKVSCLRPVVHPDGLKVTLRNGSRTGEFFVHELVAEVHVPNPSPSRRKNVRHKDGNKNNNAAANLEWF